MKKKLLLVLVVLLSINGFSQINYEKGYYINNSDQKIDCLIKNVEWKNNPNNFDFKLTEESNAENASIKSVKEFGIYNNSKYIRSTVNIDRSTEFISNLTYDGNPQFTEEELFLKVLVEGEANLYLYEEGNLKRYFYNKENVKIEQLIFKKYLNSDYEVTLNNKYKQQLLSDVNCPSFKSSKVTYLDYKEKQLVNYFIDYNKCNNPEYKVVGEKQKKDIFNLSIRPGLNSSSLSTNDSKSDNRDVDFGNQVTFRFGLEAEIIMPFNKNKWSLITEPTYQYFKSEVKLSNKNVKVDYKSIELAVGVRHYFFIDENSKIFVNGSLVLDFAKNSRIDYETGTDLDIDTINNLAFGVGYKYNNKYSVEFRYCTSRELLNDYVFWNSNYKTMSVIFGYSIF